MKIRCEKDQLLNSLQIVQKATATKTTLPILTGIYLSVTEGRLELQATDYEVGISIVIPVETIETGKAVLSGKIFPDIVRKIPGKMIEIASSANHSMITISAEKAEFKVLSFPAEEFPTLKKFESSNQMLIKDDLLKEMIRKTVFACSTDESRPLFTGALIDFSEQKLAMVATNTHRLAIKKAEVKNTNAAMKMIIPGKLLSEIAKILNNEHPIDVSLYWVKNQVAFSFENIYIMSRIIEGQFPDYKKVIPHDFAAECKISGDILFEAVERVSLLAKDGEYSIIKIKFTQTTMELSGNNPDAGSATEILDAEFIGDSLEIAFNAKYLMDFLRVAGSNIVRFHLKSSLSPVMVEIGDDNEYIYILTPIRTTN